jgi:hypothetical protein
VKNIGIYIPKPEYISGWFDTEIMREISNSNRIFIYGPASVIEELTQNQVAKTLANFEFKEIRLAKTSPVTRSYQFVSKIVWRNKNSTFSTQIKLSALGELRLFPVPFKTSRLVFAAGKNLKHLISYTLKYNFALIVFIRPIGKLFNYILKFLYNIGTYKIPNEMRLDVDVFIFLSGKHEKQLFDLIKSLKKLKIPTVLSIQNWDNLTSKSIVLTEPNYILVMGKSCIDLAVKAQNLNKNIIIPSGLPRFNPYRNIHTHKPKIKDKIFTILYLGTSVPHNEINLLNNLVSKLNNKLIGRDFKLVYKPHPYRRPTYFEEKLSDQYTLIQGKIEAFPPIKPEHIQLIEQSDLVISAPTSMLIESMLLGKKTILDVTNDGIHRTTAAVVFKKFIHLMPLDLIKNLDKCHTPEELFQCVLLAINDGSKECIKYDLQQLIENSEYSYSVNILKLLEDL